MGKLRNQYEQNGKAILRLESEFRKKAGVIFSTPEGSGRYWNGSEESEEEKENKKKKS